VRSNKSHLNGAEVVFLFHKNVLQIAAFLVSVSPVGIAAAGRTPFLKAHVHFLATSTSVHSGLGTNQDVYLVEVTPHGADETILARLIDEYPPYRATLSSKLLTSPEGATLKIRRDRACDISFAQMPLRTAPGDPMAILPERLGFQPRLSNPVEPKEVLPCYRTVR
jgi:hypothetical protein